MDMAGDCTRGLGGCGPSVDGRSTGARSSWGRRVWDYLSRNGCIHIGRPVWVMAGAPHGGVLLGCGVQTHDVCKNL